MSTQGQQPQTSSPIYRTERVIASLVMAWVIILTTYMIFQDHALSHASMYFLKIILSLSGAVMLATLPGFMDVNYTVGGFSVRAAGGAAAFVFIYTQSPNLPALKLDPAQARPAQRQPLAKSGNLSQLTNGFPTLMAFSLVAPSLMWSSAPSNAGAAQSGGVVEAEVTVEEPGAGVSLSEAVSADALAGLAAGANYARGAARQLLALLDRAAAGLRGGVAMVATKLGDLLGTVQTLIGAAPQTLAMAAEDLAARADDLASGLFDDQGAPAGVLLDHVGDLATGLLGDVQNSVDGIVSTTDHTVQALTFGLQGTTHTVLNGTEKLAHGVIDLLEESTGGLTAGLTPAADRPVSGVTSTAGRIVDGVTPVVANTTSRVLGGVADGANRLTEQLNAASPALVSKIDPDFAAGLQLPAGLESDASVRLLEKVAEKIDDGGRHAVFGGVGERHQLDARFAEPLGREAPSSGPTCIGGCGEKLLSGGGGPLRDSLGGPGTGQGRLLGSLSGGGPASGGPIAAGAGGDGRAYQGPVPSVVGSAGSLLGGATRRLGRR
jgi:hypothetical protein